MSGYELRRPAESWQESTLCGNGTLGAAVMCIPYREQIILSREDLFAPVYGKEHPIDMACCLPEIRELITNRQYRSAGRIPWEIFRQKYSEKLWTNPFIPAGDLFIETIGTEEFTDYKRTLNFETGVAECGFMAAGKAYHRTIFASRKYQKIFVKLSAKTENGEQTEQEYRITLCRHIQEKPDVVTFSYRGLTEYLKDHLIVKEREIRYVCHYGEGSDGYQVLIKLFVDENTRTYVREGTLCLQGVGDVVLSVQIERLEKEEATNETEDISFEEALKESITFCTERMGRIVLCLENKAERTDDECLYHMVREKEYAGPEFFSRIFDAGRYEIFSSCGSWPPNLQGLWSGLYQPPWSSDYTQDGNLPTAVLGLMPCGDFESMQSYFRYQELHIDEYKENSQRLYGCRGIHIPSRTSDTGYDIHFDETWPLLFWTAGAGWAARYFYDYWLYTGDRKFFVEHALPFMKEAALFYQDYLYEGPDGRWIFAPSYSPENTPADSDSAVAVNSTMDIAVAKELLINLISGCRTLELDQEENDIKQWETMLEKMPPYLVNGEGALKEWAVEDLEDRYDHRHISHLYLLFYDIPRDVRESKALYNACRKAYELKMERKQNEKGTMAFGLVQAGMVAAHLGDGEMVEKMLQSMACNDYYTTYASSHDYGPSIFNADISGGLPALILESIAQSFPVLNEKYKIEYFEVRLLPALPQSLRSGSVKGIRLRGNLTLNMDWKNGRVVTYELINPDNNKIVVLEKAKAGE